MTKYEIILYWSSDDDAFIAEVPELAGCAATSGRPDPTKPISTNSQKILFIAIQDDG